MAQMGSGPSPMHPDDPRFAEWAQSQLDIDDENVNFEESDDESDDGNVIEEIYEVASDSDYSDNSEEEGSENESENTQDTNDENYYFGKNNFNWHKKEPPSNVRTRKHNIVVTLPGPRPKAKQLGTNPKIVDVWLLLFTQDMIAEIIQWTNVKLIEVRPKYKNSQSPVLAPVDEIEIKAFLGLLIYSSVFKSGHESIGCLFATDGTGRDVFRCTMSKRRFEFLLTVLRFDDATLRKNKQDEGDPVPHVSTLFNKFIENSQSVFSLGTNVTIDEMLVAFRGRCKFKVYMPKKPARYGVKVMCLTDARNNYVFNAYIYAGKGTDSISLSETEKKLKIPSQSVIRLSKPLEKSNRNITADNWFSSIEVVQELQKRGLAYVGTLRKNKPEIPPYFQAHKNRQQKSSLYGYNNDITLLSYVPKKSKSVILISSMHHNESSDPVSGKPEIIEFYNCSKGGVDSLDKKATNYSPSRRTRRWPMAIFFALLDVSTINAYVLFTSYRDTAKLERADFLKQLARSLVLPQWERRVVNKKLPRELRQTLSRLLGNSQNIATDNDALEDRLEKRATCFLCPSKLKRKTQYACVTCRRPICLECSRKICEECARSRKE